MDNNKYFKNFDLAWEIEYFISYVAEAICQKLISNKLFNIKRHYFTFHKKNYENMERLERHQLITNLKKNVMISESFSDTQTPSTSSPLRASYIASFCIAKAKKPFSEGIFFKDVMMKICR